ncbi:MAG: mechanosensitive ion channel domain-containing protein [Synechococcus sp.]|nr:mechanosensitive ion channel domain-containing protein [Synechococcus sp.]
MEVPSLRAQAASRRLRRALPVLAFLLALALVLGPLVLGGLPPLRAAEASSAFVRVDGRDLFRVWSSNDFSAEQRVEAINGVLQGAVASPAPVRFSVEERNGLPVIALGDRALLTVTRRDTPEGVGRLEQAELWRTQLQRALERGRRERRGDHVLRMLAVAAGWLLAALLLQRLLGLFFGRLLRRLGGSASAGAEGGYGPAGIRLLLRLALRGLQAVVWLLAAGRVASLFPVTRLWLQRLRIAFWESLASPFLRLGERSYSVLDAIVLIALFLLLARALASLQRLLRTRVLQHTGIGKGSQEAIAVIVQYALLFFGSLVLLQLWGLDISSLTIFAGFFGVALGLGLQGFARNLLSGLVLVFERPIEVGDFVEVGSLQGTVQRIRLRATEVLTLDQVSIIVPNAEFIESQVVNWSHGNPVSRLVIPVGVAYGSDPEAVRSTLLEACRGYDGVLNEPAPKVLFRGFGDSQLEFSLLVWIHQPLRQYEVSSDLNFRIEAALRRAGIEIPYPQRDLHLRDGSLSLSLPPELTEALRASLPPQGSTPAPPPQTP